MKRHHVYELINLMGTVEYVGCTNNIKRRFRDHTKCKPNNNHYNGKFYGRQDLTMHIVKIVETRKEALAFEGELKLFYGLEWTEKTCVSKAGKKGGKKGGKKPSKWLRKLTFEEAQTIRQLYATGDYSQAKLAKMYGVSKMTICYIINNKIYTEE